MIINNFHFVYVIPSGFEPETHSLEGCCSIQLSYGTNQNFLKSAAKVDIFLQTTKFQTLNLIYARSSNELLPFIQPLVA